MNYIKKIFTRNLRLKASAEEKNLKVPLFRTAEFRLFVKLTIGRGVRRSPEPVEGGEGIDSSSISNTFP
jgi:hypothetical protein